MAATILIVEDEAPIAAAVAARLESHGYRTETVGDGLVAVERCATLRPDLVVLDLMLPGLDGVEVCRRIHQSRPVPVLMLTARDDEADLLVGLAVGADDYLTKPFSPRELVARVQAILRRTDPHERAGEHEVLQIGAVALDVEARRVTVAGRAEHLTPTEFDLLLSLARRDGAVRTREQLLADVWGYRDGSGSRTVDTHIRAVRRKLGDGVIRTVHGVGYALDLDGPGGAGGTDGRG